MSKIISGYESATFVNARFLNGNLNENYITSLFIRKIKVDYRAEV